MERKELIEQMKRHAGACFINRKQLASFMGYKSVNSVTQYLDGLMKIDSRYFIPEVADSLLRESR